jgi:peptidoglycan hydrolase-like protein with peptidoglycan-binding domain
LQSLLAQRGFYTGKVDGVMSAETRNAIIRAQNFYTITPADGLPSNKLVDSLTKDTFISEGN